MSLSVPEGATVAIVGESGCGKTTLARTVAHLSRPDSGTIRLLGNDVQDLNDSGFRPYRRHVQMVFQNPLGSFDPFYSIGASIAEVAKIRPDGESLEARIVDLLAEVGLSPRFAKIKPRQMSGGSSSGPQSLGLLQPGRSSSSWTSRPRRSTCRSRPGPAADARPAAAAQAELSDRDT